MRLALSCPPPSTDWRKRASRWLTRPRPCASCKCWPLSPLIGGRCPACRPKTSTRIVTRDALGRRRFAAWQPEPEVEEPRSRLKRPSRAKPKDDRRRDVALSAEETARALVALAGRFVERVFLDREGCRACPAGQCRCAWRSDVWLELVSPPLAAEAVSDLDVRIDRAVWRAESRKRRRFEKIDNG